VAADDAFFADPVVRMGIRGVEYFAHPWVLGPRFAKEVLFTGGGSAPSGPARSAW
jgi:enoyl-CoA hydratase